VKNPSWNDTLTKPSVSATETELPNFKLAWLPIRYFHGQTRYNL